MTAIEIATGIIDKLQEENRTCLETLHKAQDTIKHSERQIAEKDRLIKVLEERLRTGTDGILEMTNRQKELTIKHLELQIQKLLKENEDLEFKLEAIKSEICAKCETKLLLRENSENKSISKSYKPPSGKTGGLFEKKVVQSVCPNRIKSLERIIEHKDKRIMHLSKEVQRFTKTEKELTQKIYRLTKLLPMSRLPSETLTDCLLKEIQLLESQKKSDDSLQLHDDLLRLKSKSSLTDHASTSKISFSNSSDKIKKSSSTNFKRSSAQTPNYQATDDIDLTKAENAVLFKKLQKLCNDVNELKRLFSYESDKLSQGLNSTAKEYSVFKRDLEDIIDNLNEVIQNILSNTCFNVQQENVSDNTSDDKYVISCLQERLKESLAIVTEYENENKVLNENLNSLKKQFAVQEKIVNAKKSEERMFQLPVDSNQIQNINDVKKLKEIIKIRETQLEAAESHINTCQKFIEELQKTYKNSSDIIKMPSLSSTVNNEKISSSCESQNKTLQTKLDVAERNIKTCESVIEQLQSSVRHLEEENERLESELHVAKSQRMLEVKDSISRTKFAVGDSQINMLKKLNQDLETKVKILEQVNHKLEADIKAYKDKSSISDVTEQEKAKLKAQLETSEKHICALENSVETLQNRLKLVEEKKNKLETELKDIKHAHNLAEAYENDVMALKNEVIVKDEEIKDLKESLITLENKALEMNHYRKSLHQEIEKLCRTLTENESEDSAKRKSIYKAAVLHSAQALLRLDDDYNLKPEDSGKSSALDEMKHQIEVYLTEVSRIHELVTIKEQERDELLNEYLDLNENAGLKPSSPLQHKSDIQGEPNDPDLESSPNLQSLNHLEFNVQTSSQKTRSNKDTHNMHEITGELKSLQEELTATKSVTTYLLSSCTRLEELLAKERTERAKCERELEVYHESIKDLKSQLNMKTNITKRLNTLIDMMRSKEFNDEITLEQLKGEIKWLVDENQKIFEKVTTTQSALCQCKEENSRIQNDLDSLKRQLLNEKYENAKVNNELKHLRMQISHSQSAMNDT